MAQPFDPGDLVVTGDAFPIAEQVLYDPTLTHGVFSVSSSGVLAYQSGTASPNSQLLWRDRSGEVLGDPADQGVGAISPDGSRAAVAIVDPQSGADIWIWDLDRGIRTRFTFDAGMDGAPKWSADGSRVVFSSNRSGHFDLYLKPASGPASSVVVRSGDSEPEVDLP